MLKRAYSKGDEGQSLVEYSMVIGVVLMVLFAMTPVLKRGTQGMIKSMADQVGIQKNSEQRFDIDKSHVEESFTAVRARADKTKIEESGFITYVHGDSTNAIIESYINMGFQAVP